MVEAQYVALSDANLPSLNARQKKVFKPVILEITTDLPGLVGTQHVNHWNMGDASDEDIMRRLLAVARRNINIFWILFTRDIKFIKDAHIDLKVLKDANVDVIVLQEYVSFFQNQGYRIDSESIGHGSQAFLQEIMRRIYLIWHNNRHNPYTMIH